MARVQSARRTSLPTTTRPATLGGEDDKTPSRSSSTSSLSFSSVSSSPSSPERSGFGFLKALGKKAKRTVRRRPLRASASVATKVESEDELDDQPGFADVPTKQDDVSDEDADDEEKDEAEAFDSRDAASKSRTIATQTSGPVRPARQYKKNSRSGGRHTSDSRGHGYHKGHNSYHGNSREGSYHSSSRRHEREGSYHSNKGETRDGSYHSNKGETRDGSYHSNKKETRDGSYHSNRGENRDGSYLSDKRDYRDGTYHSDKRDYREGGYRSNRRDFRDASYHSTHRGENRDQSFHSQRTDSRDRSYSSTHGAGGERVFSTSPSEDGQLEDLSYSSTNNDGRRLRSQGRRGRRGYYGNSRSDTSRGNSSLDMSRESTGSQMSSSSSRGHFRGRANRHGSMHHRVERAPYRSYYGRRHNLSMDSGKGSSVGGASGCEKDPLAKRPETLGGELPESESKPKMNHSWRANRYSQNRNRSLDNSAPTFTLLRRETSAEPAKNSSQVHELPEESITKLVEEADKQLIKDPLSRQPSPVLGKRSHGRSKPKSQDVHNVTARTVDSHTSSDSGRSIWSSMKKLCKSKLRHKSEDRIDQPLRRETTEDERSSTSSTPRKERRRSRGHVSVTEARPSRRQPKEFPSDLRDDWKGEGCRYFFGDFTCLVPEVLKDEL